jgi:hypothetical protein
VAGSGLLLEQKWAWWLLISFFSLGLIGSIIGDFGSAGWIIFFWFAVSLVLLLTDRPSCWRMRLEINAETLKKETV